MKIIVTGSLGNISKPLVKKLIAAGHDVKVISSNEERKQAIEVLGAEALIGSVTDSAFLTNAFTGADVVYTMVPPNFGAKEYRKYISTTGEKYGEALKAAGVKKVVNLSSIGAHLDGGTGPIAGNHDVELILNKLNGVIIKHLRPGFFYVNLFHNIDMIKNAGILGSNYAIDSTLKMVHPEDIAKAAFQAVITPFESNSVQYVVSSEHTLSEVTAALGTAIGKPELQWVEFTDEQNYEGMVQAGMPQEVARVYTEMGAAVRRGILWSDYKINGSVTGKVTLADFAEEFAGVYNS
jgi:uncharacterized protein YbjT (DUF2867 family)